jgi:hypothetical protein
LPAFLVLFFALAHGNYAEEKMELMDRRRFLCSVVGGGAVATVATSAGLIMLTDAAKAAPVQADEKLSGAMELPRRDRDPRAGQAERKEDFKLPEAKEDFVEHAWHRHWHRPWRHRRRWHRRRRCFWRHGRRVCVW